MTLPGLTRAGAVARERHTLIMAAQSHPATVALACQISPQVILEGVKERYDEVITGDYGVAASFSALWGALDRGSGVRDGTCRTEWPAASSPKDARVPSALRLRA